MLRKILITGSSSGIGEALTQKCLSLGYHVIGMSRTAPSMSHPHYEHIEADFSKPKRIQPLLKTLLKKHSDISALICNAGMGLFEHLEELSEQQIEEILHVNFLSHTFIIRKILPTLKKQDHSNLLFMGSEAALKGAKKGTIYAASKFALRGLAQSLRAECASSSVHVSIIQPGMTMTPFFDELHFCHGQEEDEKILSEDIVSCVLLILNMRPGTVIDEIVLSPKKHVIRFQ